MIAILIFVLFIVSLAWVSRPKPCPKQMCRVNTVPKLAPPALPYIPMRYPRDTNNQDQENIVVQPHEKRCGCGISKHKKYYVARS